eukprot:scaffold118453_cov15-Phaeocystis_antarctica.AAC.1
MCIRDRPRTLLQAARAAQGHADARAGTHSRAQPVHLVAAGDVTWLSPLVITPDPDPDPDPNPNPNPNPTLTAVRGCQAGAPRARGGRCGGGGRA